MKKIFVFLLVYFLAFYPVLVPLANSSTDVGQGFSRADSIDETAKVQVQQTFGKIPLYFIQNNGQIDEKVKYYEKGGGHATYFTEEGVYLALQAPNSKIQIPNLKGTATNSSLQTHDPRLTTHDSRLNLDQTQIINSINSKSEIQNPQSEIVKLSPINANKQFEIIAEGLQEGKVNYFIGNDPKKWRTNIPTYTSVRYKEIYKGIDIKFYGNNRQMEYDIIVKPGGDPNSVKLAYEGIEGLKVTQEGNLEIALKQGKIIQKKPVIYQEINGEKVAVDGRFKIQTPSTLAGEGRGEGKDVIARSASDEAIPSVEIASPLARNDNAPDHLSSTHDQRQFSYSFELASYNRNHALVIDPVMVWSTYLGGGSNDVGTDIVVDTSGNAYITGYTQSGDFTVVNPIQGTRGAWYVAFVAKIDASGNIIYSTYLGGNSSDFGFGIAIDASGNAYVTGVTTSTDFPMASPIQGTIAGGSDVFVAKIDASGSSLIYSTYFGGSGSDSGSRIAVDTAGNAYITGSTDSNDFPTAFPIYYLNKRGNYDVFVTKINAAGSNLVYSTYLGGSGDDGGSGIAVDALGNMYITGFTTSTDFPIVSPIQENNAGVSDAFITKVSNTGSVIIYSTYLGGSGSDNGADIDVDKFENAYVTGSISTGTFTDVFVIKVNALGNKLIYSTFGGNEYDYGTAIAADASGNAYITGYNTASDVLVIKINTSSSPASIVYSTYFGGYGPDEGFGIAADTNGNAYITGHNSNDNVFVAKISDFYLAISNAGTGSGTVTSEPVGIICGTDCTEVYDKTTEVTLTATPSANSTFVGWSGNGCSGTGTCTVTVDTSKTITAIFDILPIFLIPSIPSNLTVYADTSSKIILTWRDNSSNEIGFKIEMKSGSCDDLINPWSQIGMVGTNVTSYSIARLSPTNTYSYRVRAYNEYGNSDYSNCATYAGNQGTSNAPGLKNAPGVQTAPGLKK